jgi:hypothetical protein
VTAERVGARPSWAEPPRPAASPSSDRARHGRPPATLVVAGAGAAALAGAGVVHVLGRDDLEPALRVALAGVLALQVALVVLALRGSAAAVMVLLLCVLTMGPAALAGGLGGARALLASGAGAVLALLARSLRWFPGYELPRREAP